MQSDQRDPTEACRAAASAGRRPCRVRRRWSIVLGLGLLGAIALGYGALRLHRAANPRELHAWTSGLQAPELVARYRSATATHLVAVYQRGRNELVFFCRRIQGSDGEKRPQLQVEDEWGRSVVAPERQIGPAFWRADLGWTTVQRTEGAVIPIHPGFRGRMRLILRTPDAQAHSTMPDPAPDRMPSLMDVHIRWGEPAEAQP